MIWMQHTRGTPDEFYVLIKKIFTVKETFNKQKVFSIECMLLHHCMHLNSFQKFNKSYIWLLWGPAYDIVAELHFCDNGVRTTVTMNPSNVLEKIVKHLNKTLF